MFAFLGLLLLGIGLASGLIPLHRQTSRPEIAAAPSAPEKPATILRSQTPQAASPAVGAVDSRPRRTGRAVLAKAPCPNPDTSAVERLLREDKAADPARLEAAACQASLGYQSASPDTLPPDTAAANASHGEPIFITPYDTVAR
jgi:hypothetical protein